jgi:hypothetical protein
MTSTALGANAFTFSGDRTEITFYPDGHGPIVAGTQDHREQMIYAGPEGQVTFSGSQISLADTALGALISVTFPANPDAGVTTLSLLVPNVVGVTGDTPVTFATVAIVSHHRGSFDGSGADQTYDVLPLVGQAKAVILPL